MLYLVFVLMSIVIISDKRLIIILNISKRLYNI